MSDAGLLQRACQVRGSDAPRLCSVFIVKSGSVAEKVMPQLPVKRENGAASDTSWIC
ncbi:hypothetical protein C4J99_2081 [Pseudomonas synxantha]|nr:hypothetical protein C4J99_2081 [Pseudomonas synxantha]